MEHDGSLIAFRAVQGIGAGAVQPIGMTIVGDIYSVEERAKVQGYLASVWALSAVIGPTLGGLFSDYLSWRWIFFVNLPLGAAARGCSGGASTSTSSGGRTASTAGAVLLTGGGVLLLLGLLEGGVRWDWASPISIALFVGAAALLVAFVLVERRAAEPVLPLWVFRHRVIVAAILTSLVVGVLMMGLTSYVPLYGQSVLGHGAVAAGFALAALTLGWPLSASNSGRLYLTIGFRVDDADRRAHRPRRLAAAAHPGRRQLAVPPRGAVLRDGPRLRLRSRPRSSPPSPRSAGSRAAVATGATMFARTVGSAVGVAVFGAIVNAHVTAAVGHANPDLEHLSPAVLEPAIQTVFVGSAIVAVALVVVGLLMPRRIDGECRQRTLWSRARHPLHDRLMTTQASGHFTGPFARSHHVPEALSRPHRGAVRARRQRGRTARLVVVVRAGHGLAPPAPGRSASHRPALRGGDAGADGPAPVRAAGRGRRAGHGRGRRRDRHRLLALRHLADPPEHSQTLLAAGTSSVVTIGP